MTWTGYVRGVVYGMSKSTAAVLRVGTEKDFLSRSAPEMGVKHLIAQAAGLPVQRGALGLWTVDVRDYGAGSMQITRAVLQERRPSRGEGCVSLQMWTRVLP